MPFATIVIDLTHFLILTELCKNQSIQLAWKNHQNIALNEKKDFEEES